MKLFLVYVLVLLETAVAGPAPDISKLKITDCNCQRCLVTQTGYALRGSVTMEFNGSKVTCSSNYIVNYWRIVIGWNYYCPISGSSGGTFEVSYNGLGHQICGKSFDRLILHSCSGRACSSFG